MHNRFTSIVFLFMATANYLYSTHPCSFGDPPLRNVFDS